MRDKILDAAERMVQQRGLDAVSFQDIADAVGLRKASLFHYFKNTEALAKALIERCETKYLPLFDEVAKSNATAPEKLKRMAVIYEKGLHESPCLIAALCSGFSTLSESAGQELGEVARATVACVANVFDQGRREASLDFDGKPLDAARGFFAMLQGLQVLLRASGTAAHLRKSAAVYIKSITRS